jgi:hypothetical protein
MGALQLLLHRLETVALERPIALGIVVTILVLGLFKLWASRSRAHNLPVVKVTSNDVVGFLEEAHKKVSHF